MQQPQAAAKSEKVNKSAKGNEKWPKALLPRKRRRRRGRTNK